MNKAQLKTVVTYRGLDKTLVEELVMNYPSHYRVDNGAIRRLIQIGNDCYVYSYSNPLSFKQQGEYHPFQYYTRMELIRNFYFSKAGTLNQTLPKREFMREAMIKLGVR